MAPQWLGGASSTRAGAIADLQRVAARARRLRVSREPPATLRPLPMGDLRGKRALVTGASQGIGLAIGEALLQAGCEVALHYFTSDSEPLLLADRYAGRVRLVPGDLTQPALARQVTEQAVEALGGLDVLVNNTGSLVARRTLEEIDADFWRTVMNLNMETALHVTRAALPALKRAGEASVVNLSSLAGRKGGHGGSLAYASAKGAMLTWTRALAQELGPCGVRVNAVAPGLILGTSFHARHTSDHSAQKTVESLPLGRAGAPADVARAVVYLASEFDGFITGATLDINGGVYCA